jgi:hypothetical protein
MEQHKKKAAPPRSVCKRPIELSSPEISTILEEEELQF